MSEAVDALLDALGGRSRARLASACAPDVHWEDPLTDAPLRGPEALADHLARFWAAFPDGRVERVADVLGDGEQAAAPVLVRGRHTGETSLELPPTGRELELHAVIWCRVADGRVGQARAFFDLYEAARQLGVLPSRGTIGERALLLLRGFGLRAG